MDQNLREYCRECSAGVDAACLQAFIGYRRAGFSSQEMPREVLYGKTRYQLLHQDPLDFRSFLVRSGRIFRAVTFNDGVNISIQGHRGAYCKPREDLPDPRMYAQLEFLFDVPVKQTELYIPSHLIAEIIQGLTIISVGLSQKVLKDMQIIKEAMANPLCKIRQEQFGNGPLAETQVTIRQFNPDFLEGGIYYGFPHPNSFSPYDQSAPYVPVEEVQDIFDFLRARFGLPEQV